MMFKRFDYLYAPFFLLCMLCACHNKHIPDVSDIKVSPIIRRLDMDLMSADTLNMALTYSQMKTKYPLFFGFYCAQISGFGNGEDTGRHTLYDLKQYLTSKYTHQLFDSIKKGITEKDLTQFKEEFTSACRFYKYYFPKAPVPQVYFYADGFSYATVTANDSIIGIASEMYLGENFSIYQRLADPIPHYITRLCRPNYMARNAIYDLLNGLYSINEDGATMLDLMVHNGKLMYATKQMMPYTSDSIITTLSEKQLQFCQKNEAEFWKYFVKENLLYNRNSKDYSKYVQPGPECITTNCQPYGLGNWLGLRIVEQYMEKHPDISLQTLMKMNNAQSILQQSGYKP